MRFAFIAKNADMLPVERLCQIMDVSPRGYRAFRNRPLSLSQRKDLVVLAHIREQFTLSLGSYGRPRMTEELKELGLEVGHRRVGRLMSENGIEVKRTRSSRRRRTATMHAFNIAPNLLNRDFHADHPSVSDLLCMSDLVHASPKGSMNDHLKGNPGQTFTGR